MNNHEKLSKFSYQTRLLAVERITDDGWKVSATASAIGASRRSVYTWLKRFKAEGSRGLHDRSSRPLNCPRALPAEAVDAMCELRDFGCSLSQIASALNLVRSSVHRCLKRIGRHLLPKEPREAVQRYEAAEPGELLHIDIKKLRGFDYAGRKFIDSGGRRLRGAPRQYLHVCVDSHSRYAFCKILPRENADACILFLKAAVDHFAQLGIRVQRILTDNASAYKGKAMAHATAELQLRHSFTRVRRPQTNGKAERFIRTAMTEWGYLRYENSRDRDAALPGWVEYYNHRRSHSSLAYKPPVSRINGEPPIET